MGGINDIAFFLDLGECEFLPGEQFGPVLLRSVIRTLVQCLTNALLSVLNLIAL